jgi:hypothetical protein
VTSLAARMFWQCTLSVLGLALTFTITFALAHDAPSGWHYPIGCCNEGDCKPVPCDSITETKDGYEWHGILFNSTLVRPSGDQSCHVCVGQEWSADMKSSKDKFPHCIFIQPST